MSLTIESIVRIFIKTSNEKVIHNITINNMVVNKLLILLKIGERQ